jgi:hypothetical protein
LKLQFKNVIVKNYMPVMYTTFNNAIDDYNNVANENDPFFINIAFFLKKYHMSMTILLKICVQNFMMIG